MGKLHLLGSEDTPGDHDKHMTSTQWIGLRGNLQETMVFTIKCGVFL